MTRNPLSLSLSLSLSLAFSLKPNPSAFDIPQRNSSDQTLRKPIPSNNLLLRSHQAQTKAALKSGCKCSSTEKSQEATTEYKQNAIRVHAICSVERFVSDGGGGGTWALRRAKVVDSSESGCWWRVSAEAILKCGIIHGSFHSLESHCCWNWNSRRMTPAVGRVRSQVSCSITIFWDLVMVLHKHVR